MFTEFFFCLQLDTNLSVPFLEAQNTLFAIQVVLFLFFLLGEMKDIFQFGFIFTDGEDKER